MRILLITAMAFLPALAMGEDAAAAVNFQPICDFHNREIQRLERNVEELVEDVVMESDLYVKLKNSSNMCGVIGYLALPECATKEGVNVFDKLDDKCAENKTNSITKSLQKLLRLDTIPSGPAIFRSCKDIVVKQLLGQFEKMLELISSLCDQSMGTSARRKRSSYGGGYYPGGYDSSTIWFQYLLCHEQKITCYFFTEGWNEKQYGQYYLYQNLFDTDFPSIGQASTGGVDDLLALALLSGAGVSQQYHPQAYPAYSSYKKRREVEGEGNDEINVTDGNRRQGHIRFWGYHPVSIEIEDEVDTAGNIAEDVANNVVGRKRRSTEKKKKGKKKNEVKKNKVKEIECVGDCEQMV